MLLNFRSTTDYSFTFLVVTFLGGFLRLEVAKEGNFFFKIFLMIHMTVLLTRKPPTVDWMRLYSYRAKYSQLYSWEYLCLWPWSCLPHLGSGWNIKAAFALFCWPKENIVAFHAGDVELFKQNANLEQISCQQLIRKHLCLSWGSGNGRYSKPMSLGFSAVCSGFIHHKVSSRTAKL